MKIEVEKSRKENEEFEFSWFRFSAFIKNKFLKFWNYTSKWAVESKSHNNTDRKKHRKISTANNVAKNHKSDWNFITQKFQLQTRESGFF